MYPSGPADSCARRAGGRSCFGYPRVGARRVTRRDRARTVLGLLGAFYACTDGVLPAMASVAVPGELRSSGIAILTTAAALSGFLASLSFGAMWSWWGPSTTIAVFFACLIAMIGISARLLRVNTRSYG
jgi:hypothetical protein